MSTSQSVEVVRSLGAAVDQEGFVLISAALFGSATVRSDADDVDCTIILRDDAASSESFDYDLQVVRARMEGDYGAAVPSDPTFAPLRSRLAQIADERGYKFWAGLGSIDRGFEARRVHLQGPVTSKQWDRYANAFPIVAWSIKLHAIEVLGSPVYAGAITCHAVESFAHSMRQRLDREATPSYARKCMQGLHVVLGGTATDWLDTRSAMISSGIVTDREAPIDLSTSDFKLLATICLDTLNEISSSGPADKVLRAASADS